jgi:hypothetical protein
MTIRSGTKETAEALLRELPSVLGAFVREDINGHPREVHLLITPGPKPGELARDIRALLQEHLGIRVDQRVISIAQLSKDLDPLPPVPLEEADSASANDAPPAGSSSAPPRERPGVAPAAPRTIPRVIYQGLESSVREGRVEIRVSLSWQDQGYTGEERELDGGLGRIRAAAVATLRAAAAAANNRVRFDLDSVSTTRALGREYILISVLASSPILGRRPLTLIGAQPLEFDAETTAALATLQATNRILALVLDH